MPKAKAPTSGAIWWHSPPKFTESDRTEILNELFSFRQKRLGDPDDSFREATWASIVEYAGSYRGRHKKQQNAPTPTQTEVNAETAKIKCAARKLREALCDLDEDGSALFRERTGRHISEIPANGYVKFISAVSSINEWLDIPRERRLYGKASICKQVEAIHQWAERLDHLFSDCSFSVQDRMAKTFNRASGYMPGLKPYDLRVQLLLIEDLGSVYIRFPKSYRDPALYWFLFELALLWGKTTGKAPGWRFNAYNPEPKWSPFYEWAKHVVEVSANGEWSPVVPEDLVRDAMKCARWTLER